MKSHAIKEINRLKEIGKVEIMSCLSKFLKIVLQIFSCNGCLNGYVFRFRVTIDLKFQKICHQS